MSAPASKLGPVVLYRDMPAHVQHYKYNVAELVASACNNELVCLYDHDVDAHIHVYLIIYYINLL